MPQTGFVIANAMMTKPLRDVLAHAESWPREDQEELAEYAREIEARRTGIYTMSEQDRAAVKTGLAEADQGQFVADEIVAAADKREDSLGRGQAQASGLGNSGAVVVRPELC